MHKLNAFPILPVALGALLCAAGIGLLYKADTLTVRLMQATGADVLSRDFVYAPETVPTPAVAEKTVQRAARWSLPVHTFGLCLIGLGAWFQVRALRRGEQSSLNERTQGLLAEWVLMRATLKHRLASGVVSSSQDAVVLIVLDYLVARYSVPGFASAVLAPPRGTPSVSTQAVSLVLRRFRGAPKQSKDSAVFRTALEEIRRLNLESYADFGFSKQLRRSADYN